MTKIDVLDKGYVRLRDKMGDDLKPADVARVSFDRRAEEFTDEQNERLVNYLFRNKEYSCIRHNVISLEVYMPLMVARQIYKYSIASSFREDQNGWNESCLPLDQEVTLWDGQKVPLEEVFKDKDSYALRSVNEENILVPNTIKDFWSTGTAKVFEIEDEVGNKVMTTENHRISTLSGYVRMGDLKEGDSVVYDVEPLWQTGVSTIVSKRYVKTVECFDIEMTHESNFVAGGIVVHNSRRYITEEPEFYIPEHGQWRTAPENKKQGSGQPLPDSKGKEFTDMLMNQIDQSVAMYDKAIDEGIAVEQARVFLPAYGMYVRAYWTASLNAIFHFLDERLAGNAQSEIRDYAEAVEGIIKQEYPVIYSAWANNK